MNVTDAFKGFQNEVNADIVQVREARARRDLFKGAFGAESDVKEVIPSGSLARGTHKDPIHDVDTIIVFDQDEHPTWGASGSSAAEALDYTRERANALLGATNGTYEHAVRLALPRNHAVKCFLDDPDDDDAFTVDAMPALRRGGQLLVPEKLSEHWILCDPEFLIAEVASRHARWNKFAGTVRMLKRWAADQPPKIKSLVMEVLALDCLPVDVNQPAAVKEFFVRAYYYIESGNAVSDPAGLCGPIQDDLDRDELLRHLGEARDSAAAAILAQVNNDTSSAIASWREVFGDAFPKPSTSASPLPAVTPMVPRPVKDTPQG